MGGVEVYVMTAKNQAIACTVPASGTTCTSALGNGFGADQPWAVLVVNSSGTGWSGDVLFGYQLSG